MVLVTRNSNLPFTIPQWLPSKISPVVIKPPFFFSSQDPNFLYPHLLHIFFLLSGFVNHVSTRDETCPCVLPPWRCIHEVFYHYSKAVSPVGFIQPLLMVYDLLPTRVRHLSSLTQDSLGLLRQSCTLPQHGWVHRHFHGEAHQMMSDRLRV